MPKPRGRKAGSKARRGAPVKRAAKAPAKKVRKVKAVSRKRRVVTPKKRVRARVPAKATAPVPTPVPKPVPKPAAPSEAVVAPKAAPSPKRIERKEATSMADQAKCPIHNSTECFKPALDAYIQKAYDGYCTKIDWPFVRSIPKGWKPG